MPINRYQGPCRGVAGNKFPGMVYIGIMLKDGLLLVIALLFVVSMLAMLSTRLRISYPILLVLAGLGISVIPGIPQIRLDPGHRFYYFPAAALIFIGLEHLLA